MLVLRRQIPIVSKVFRRMNKRVSTISPLSVEASLRHMRMGETPIKGSLDIDITEKRTGKGVPLAPFIVYLNDVEEFKGRCNTKGKYTHELSFKDHSSTIDVYHDRKRLVEASDSLRVLWDNFNDNDLDREIWDDMLMKSPAYVGEASVNEIRSRLEIYCGNTGYGGGVFTAEPVNISNGQIEATLYTDVRATITGIAILPAGAQFWGPPYNAGYDFYVFGAL